MKTAGGTEADDAPGRGTERYRAGAYAEAEAIFAALSAAREEDATTLRMLGRER
jgi:hypothetical protein